MLGTHVIVEELHRKLGVAVAASAVSFIDLSGRILFRC